MRIALTTVVGAAVLSGCMSDFRPRFVLPSDCDRQLFFEDLDGDGWGDPQGAFESLCQADPESSLTSRNNLDCDDDDPVNTGRIATLCPSGLVTGGASFKPLAVSGAEAVAVLPSEDFAHFGDPEVETTPIVWSNAAAEACGENGWGGGLATFGNLTELTAVTDAIAAEMPTGSYYAGWVGLVPSADGRTWVWEGRDGGLNLAEVGFCVPDDAPDPEADERADRRVALVRLSSGRWCFGYPSDANPASVPEGGLVYTDLDAHFVCSRPTPQATAYTVDQEPS